MASEANTSTSIGLLQRPLGDVLDALASQHEIAGGGGPAAALTAAAAAALTAKVARASRGTWIEAGGAIAHAESLRAQIQALSERDAEAYREASSMLMQAERSARHGVVAPAGIAIADDERERLVDEALTHAAELALAIAELASEIAELAADVVVQCSVTVAPDALTAVILAEAAASSAAWLVEINRQLPADDPRRAHSRAAAEVARRARERATRLGARTMPAAPAP